MYHLILRGIDDNLIFKDQNDYYRGIFSIYEFNNSKPVTIQHRRRVRARIKKESEKGGPSVKDEREKLVEVCSFALMPNHLHLLAKQIKRGGVTKFMSKVGTGYGGYFNRKYARKGYVFQDRFISIRIRDEEQLKTLFVYIHTNPVSLSEPKWKENGIKNPKEVIKFLEKYKWSSYQDYIGKNNFPSVTDRDAVLKIIGDEQNCKNFIESWIRHKGKIRKLLEAELKEK